MPDLPRSSALRWRTRCAGGRSGLLLPHEGHQRRDTYGPGDQGSLRASLAHPVLRKGRLRDDT
eukprot:11384708-Alexandrium_andersonii.AAC.1